MTLDEMLLDLWCHVRTADETRDLVEGLMFRELHNAEAAERKACAEICKDEAKRLAASADRMERRGYANQAGPVRGLAWKCNELKERIEDRGKQ